MLIFKFFTPLEPVANSGLPVPHWVAANPPAVGLVVVAEALGNGWQAGGLCIRSMFEQVSLNLMGGGLDEPATARLPFPLHPLTLIYSYIFIFIYSFHMVTHMLSICFIICLINFIFIFFDIFLIFSTFPIFAPRFCVIFAPRNLSFEAFVEVFPLRVNAEFREDILIT